MKIFNVLCLVLCVSVVCAQPYRQLEKLPAFVNSGFDEITPVPSRDGRTLFFTRVGYPEFDHTLFIDSVDASLGVTPESYSKTLSDVCSQIAGYHVANPERSAFNQDVWLAELSDSAKVKYVWHPGYPLNNALPNSLVTMTPDPNACYIINQFQLNGNMDRGFSVIRQLTDTSWAFPVPVEIENYYTITSDVSLTMSFDGKILILSATRYDSRDMDLYVSFRKAANKWSEPQHLGNVINSAQRETTPYLSEDNTTLYFSSNRLAGPGARNTDNDIYMSRRLDDTWKNWTVPVRLDEPINSKSDESQPYFNMTTGYLYFTSKRDGNSDIFRVQIAPPQPTELLVKGRIINRKTRELMRNARVFYSAKGNPPNSLNAPDGLYSLKVPRGVQFELVASKPAFTGKIEQVEYPWSYYYFREQYVDLYLDPMEIDATIELEPIFFQQAKAEIIEESYPELERLSATMLENPSLHIRIEGHTDNLGRPEDLLKLSEERAAAIKTFLVQKGVRAERIETIGYGSKFPKADNNDDNLRPQNRRVEVRIIKI
jgi:outer membrane protein OmpA-like peptidoglycan-associated protein